MTEQETLARMLDVSWDYGRYYFRQLKGQDLHRRFELNGMALNTAYWLYAHMTSSENWLVLRGAGGELVKLPWAKLFNVGATPPKPEDLPPIEEILAASKEVHAKVVAHVLGMSDADLELPHNAMVNIPAITTRRDIILHCIRHGSGHAGQLGILCKLYGLKTI